MSYDCIMAHFSHCLEFVSPVFRTNEAKEIGKGALWNNAITMCIIAFQMAHRQITELKCLYCRLINLQMLVIVFSKVAQKVKNLPTIPKT